MIMTQPLFGFLVVISFIAMLGGLFVLPLPQDTATVQLLTTFLGILAGSFNTVVSFYFGSSTGAKGKDETIAKIATGTSGPSNGNGSAQPKPGDPGTVAMSGTVVGTMKEKDA